MMGVCTRIGVWVGLRITAIFLALPACLLLLWVAFLCTWVLGLLSVARFVLRLWNPRIQAMAEEQRKQKKEKLKKKLATASHGLQELVCLDESAELRLPLVQQYLEDQLNTLGDRLAHQLFHVGSSDSPAVHHAGHCDSDHVGSSDLRFSHVSDQDWLQNAGREALSNRDKSNLSLSASNISCST